MAFRMYKDTHIYIHIWANIYIYIYIYTYLADTTGLKGLGPSGMNDLASQS